MIVGIINLSALDACAHTMASVPDEVTAIEWRLDALATLEVTAIAKLVQASPRPTILTLRSQSQGGNFKGSETDRLAALKTLAKAQPAYMDVESCVPNAWLTAFASSHPKIRIIRSHHAFDDTPEDLDGILDDMQHPAAHCHKVITHANNTMDMMRLLAFLQRRSCKATLTAHCIGAWGVPSRLIAPVLGSHMQYVMLAGTQAAPGCLDTNAMRLYRCTELDRNTRIYALLGDPVDHSVGHVFHNEVFASQKQNAVYVKMRLPAKQLAAFLAMAHDLPFDGFSVTTPLKEAIVPHMQQLDDATQAIGAVNTVIRHADGWHGSNTDGLGACDAIHQHQHIRGQAVLILGAGGTAKAMAHACVMHQPKSITVVNRNLERAKQLCETLTKHGGDKLALAVHASCVDVFASSKPKQLDVIINTIPMSEQNDAWFVDLITPHLKAGTVYLQADYRHDKAVIMAQLAALGCITLDGRALFAYQAQRQQKIWPM